MGEIRLHLNVIMCVSLAVLKTKTLMNASFIVIHYHKMADTKISIALSLITSNVLGMLP